MWIYWKTGDYEPSASEIPVFLPILPMENNISESEPGNSTNITEEIAIVQPLESDWDQFLRRRAIPLPSLASSLQPWLSDDTAVSPVPFTPLQEKPDLAASSDVSCTLRKFGFTKAQADETYNPNKRLRRCADLASSFITLQEK
jgi:hypothetical protein